ncbi:MAG: hypothetical protein GOV15_02995, partial [Candidatus Diapherotrites archaeon]|nr:hypothetical protein [Candidatus Diapherotrites archaeon]
PERVDDCLWAGDNLGDAANEMDELIKKRDNLYEKIKKDLEIKEVTQDIIRSRQTKQRVKRGHRITTKKKTLRPAGDEEQARKHERK